MNKTSEEEHVIHSVILSIFEAAGPTPVACYPNILAPQNQLIIAMKSISLLMGEQVYQEGKEFDSIKYFGILPFPDVSLTGLTYFFLINDPTARGMAKASTISILVDEAYTAFLYEQMKDLSSFIAETADEVLQIKDPLKLPDVIQKLYEKIHHYTSNVQAPLIGTRNIKVLFTGLDASGKSSFLRAIKQKFSELTTVKPTRGIERSEETILGRGIIEWDVGGQAKYRTNFLKQADLYLYDSNLLFFLVDIRDADRYPEALEFFQQITNIFESFNQHPPIIINLHKMDPDIIGNVDLKQSIELLQQKFLEIGAKFKLRFFSTSIFNPYSLIKSFSEGIGAMSPNRELLRGQLRWLAGEINAQALLLLSDNSLILSDYAVNEDIGRISEISAPHFQNLYRTFTEFHMLKRNMAVWRMDEEVYVFFRIPKEKLPLYLLCLIKNTDHGLSVLETKIPEFDTRIETLLQSYL